MTERLHVRNDALEGAIATIIADERTLESYWNQPNVPCLIFADHTLPGTPAQFHGGPIGTGLPVQLIFWGLWWNSADGAQRRAMITDRTQRLINSPYFSELAQYGIQPPTFRGPPITVLEPLPPASFTDSEEQRMVTDLIDDLIDDDVFPDPDDGRIAFAVMMPKGFTQTIGANGAHTSDFDQDFLDTDMFWVAWVRYFDPDRSPNPDDPEDTIRTLSHELCELFTDPEGDAWYVEGAGDEGEISDGSESATPTGSVKQAAWVNGARAAAYWSNRHGATIIPVDRDYRARIRGSIKVTKQTTIVEGHFRPHPAESRLCAIVDACCFGDRDYAYAVKGRNEKVTLRMEADRYYSPVAAWTVGGKPVKGSGTVTVRVTAEEYTGRMASYADRDVTIGYVATDSSLTLTTTGQGANFDVVVGCDVTDSSIEGNVKVNVVAKPRLTVGFAGAQLHLDPEYVHQQKACDKALHESFGRKDSKAFGRPKPGEPVEINPAVLAALPAYTRIGRFREMRQAAALSWAASRVLDRDRAADVQAGLAVRLPILHRRGD